MNDILDITGKQIIENVRDLTIYKIDKVITGEVKSEQAQCIYQGLSNIDAKDKKAIKNLILLTVDSSIHNLLCLMEESDDIDISFASSEETIPKLSEESDGFAGELYTEDGWIERFSQYPTLYK